MGATIHGKVIEQNFVENKAEQLWTKGMEDDDGYFTLKNFENSKLMTAISEYGLETKGNWYILLMIQVTTYHQLSIQLPKFYLDLGVNSTDEDESEDLGIYAYETGKLMVDLG